jgi:site-specific DNA-methyltransferase (adenine-specific)
MKPFYKDGLVTIHHGDCREVLATIEGNSVDALVTDPPYGLEFMGKEWDKLGCASDTNGFHRKKHDADVGRANVFGRTSRTSPEYKLGGAGIEKTAKSAGGFGKNSATNENAFAAARIRYGKSVANIQEWHRLWAVEALRVLKPGAHALVFGGTRTHHRLMCGLEDAGFEIRDCVLNLLASDEKFIRLWSTLTDEQRAALAEVLNGHGLSTMLGWLYGSGFPKSLDVSKSIDKAAGVERETISEGKPGAANQWAGWGTALKPAWEPIIIARKPLEGIVAENVLKYGTGALNIDGCRVGFNGDVDEREAKSKNQPSKFGSGPMTNQIFGKFNRDRDNYDAQGRWPANLIHDGSDEVVSGFPQTKGIGHHPRERGSGGLGCDGHAGQRDLVERFGDVGSAARFFYTPKASGVDRGNKTDLALPLFGIEEEKFRNTHPTVKPVALMEYLIKLVTRPNAVLLDCFLGSGSTLVAAKRLGRQAIGIESDEDSCLIAVRRVERITGGPEDRKKD